MDDISATVVTADLDSLPRHLHLTRNSVRGFADLSSGRLNMSKCFTYGDKQVQHLVPAITQHMETFRLVGGSITCGKSSSWSEPP